MRRAASLLWLADAQRISAGRLLTTSARKIGRAIMDAFSLALSVGLFISGVTTVMILFTISSREDHSLSVEPTASSEFESRVL